MHCFNHSQTTPTCILNGQLVNNTESLNSTIQSTGLEIKQVDIKDILGEKTFFSFIAAISIKQHTDGAEHSGVNITRLSSPVTVQTSISDKTVAM